jgi:mRNA interferase MazF
MTVYEKGDIILVPFPFSELTSMKKRPALVMASIEHRDELICMMQQDCDPLKWAVRFIHQAV